MKPLILVAALCLPTLASAHDPLTTAPYAPDTRWLVAPASGQGAGQSPIRIVSHNRTEALMLTPNQVSLYQKAYRRSLTRLAMHMSVHRAEARARHAAAHAVLRRYPDAAISSATTVPLDGGRLLPGG